MFRERLVAVQMAEVSTDRLELETAIEVLSGRELLTVRCRELDREPVRHVLTFAPLAPVPKRDLMMARRAG